MINFVDKPTRNRALLDVVMSNDSEIATNVTNIGKDRISNHDFRIGRMNIELSKKRKIKHIFKGF